MLICVNYINNTSYILIDKYNNYVNYVNNTSYVKYFNKLITMSIA